MRSAAYCYLLVLAAAVLGIVGLLRLGSALPVPVPGAGVAVSHAVAAEVPAAQGGSVLDSALASLGQNSSGALSRLFLQLLVIISASRLMGAIFTRFGQPAVVGEMAAGILLGPSLFGLVAPDAFHFVFAAGSLDTLRLMSQVGVCLFMFCVGMEVDLGHVRNQARTAVMVSNSGILVPYFLGVSLAYFLYGQYAQPGSTFLAFALFMGISMSVTAFPVLARILQERNLTRTSLGATAITCAAMGDVTAWSILAIVVAIVRAASVGATILNLGLVAVFIALMAWGVRPVLLRWLGRSNVEEGEGLSKSVLVVVTCVVMGASLCSEIIGIHALFGAFLSGAIMPESAGFRHKLAVRLENFSSVLLLPLFFVFVGLRTQVGLLSGAQGGLVCLLIITVATVGKLGGSALPAWLCGMPGREALKLGALMNTRGLMELIVLNLGYDLGILSPSIFAMLVIMALVTTMLTGPLLVLFGYRQPALTPARSAA